MSFTKWLVRQRKRDDLVGDLARDVAVDPNWPSTGGLADCSRYLERRKPPEERWPWLGGNTRGPIAPLPPQEDRRLQTASNVAIREIPAVCTLAIWSHLCFSETRGPHAVVHQSAL